MRGHSEIHIRTLIILKLTFRLQLEIPACTDVGEQHEVTIQIKNVLAQVVAIPILEGVTNTVSSSTLSLDGTTPVSRLRLGCGNYSAYWGGKVQGTNKEAASGIYLVVFTVDGEFAGSKRIFNRK